MRTLGKAIRTARAEQKDWQKELNNFLRNYRSTPHSSTGKSPAEWTICITDQRSNYAGRAKSFTTARKRKLKLVEWQSLVSKCCKIRKI